MDPAAWRSGWTTAPHAIAWVVLPLYVYVRSFPLFRPTAGELARFAGGVVVLFLALISPLHRAADEASFLLHVAQHMMLQMVAPPLLLLGIPGHVWERVGSHQGVRRALGALLHPLVAGVAYNGMLLLWHWPVPTEGGVRLACGVATDLAARSPIMAVLQDLLPFWVGLAFWASVILPPPISPAAQGSRFAMLLGSMVVNWLLSFSIALQDAPMYATYAGARPPFGLSPLDDQKLGAGVMWEHGNMTYVVALLALLRRVLRERSARGDVTARSGVSLGMGRPITR